jgi:hypothetical protein
MADEVMADPQALISCRFDHRAPADAIYALSDGCLCYPDDREQALCRQHIDRATPLGTMTLVRDLGVEWADGWRPT